MLIGLGGVDSSAPACVPSKTQSVETSTTFAPTSLAASTTWRVAPTYASHPARRSVASRAGSLRIALCTIASGLLSSTLARTASASVRSSSRWVGATTSAPWRSANTFTTLLPTNPDPPVTNTRTMPIVARSPRW